jgi:hypothetical protein
MGRDNCTQNTIVAKEIEVRGTFRSHDEFRLAPISSTGARLTWSRLRRAATGSTTSNRRSNWRRPESVHDDAVELLTDSFGYREIGINGGLCKSLKNSTTAGLFLSDC